MKQRIPLDLYDEIPEEMAAYLRHNGWHFNHKACRYAVSMMRKKNPASGRMDKVEVMEKEQVDAMLSKYGVTLENNVGYDYVFVANDGKAKFHKSSIADEQRLAMYVKDVIDDELAGDGEVMRKWDAEMTARGIPVEWEEML